MLSREQIDFLLSKAYNAAIRAGARIMEIYTEYDDFYVNMKSDSTPITIADREAHRLITEYLSQTRIPLMSEEGRDLLYEERRNWDLYWLVDPLDGTEEFIKCNGEFTVNIALMVDNKPCIGVVYMPTTETIYFNDPENGAYLKTHVRPIPDAEYPIAKVLRSAKQLPLLGKANNPIRVVSSRSHSTDETVEYVQALKQKYGKVDILEFGSSYKLCIIAEGSADYYIRTSPTMEWDTAAGQAIVEASGGSIRDLEDTELYYNQECLTNPPFMCKTKFVR